MPTDDRKNITEATLPSAGLTIDDLPAEQLDEQSADEVKGGITVTKNVDVSSPQFFRST